MASGEHPWFEARAGLGVLAAALKSRECVIAYVGASVTAQRDGHRPRLHAWLESWSGRRHRAVNAGFGAVGAVSAVFTLEDLALRHRPDLCLIDYSSGDTEARSPAAQLGPAVEGMVRQLTDIGCRVVILHLYRHDRAFARRDAVISAYERVADHYGIPSIHVGRRIEAAIVAGTESGERLFRDGIHPTAAGADLTTHLLAEALGAILALAPDPGGGDDRPPLAPLHPRPYRRTSIAAATASMLRQPELGALGRLRFLHEYVSAASGNAFTCVFDAELVGVVVVIGPEAGVVRVRTPLGSRAHRLWDEDCHYERLSTLLFEPPLPPRTPVEIELTDLPVDYSGARRPVENPAAIEKRLKVVGFMLVDFGP